MSDIQLKITRHVQKQKNIHIIFHNGENYQLIDTNSELTQIQNLKIKIVNVIKTVLHILKILEEQKILNKPHQTSQYENNNV